MLRTVLRLILALAAIFMMASSGVSQDFDGRFAEAVEGNPGATGPDVEEERLETDRDSFTPATTLVGQGRSMLESSYSFIENRDAANSHSFPELLTRVGVTDWLELRLGWNYETGGGGAVSGSEVGGNEDTASGETETKVLYGVKIALSEQDDWLPRSALIAHAATPTSGSNTATQFVAAYVAGWTLPNRWNLDGSLRYVAANEEGDHFDQWAPSIVLKVPLSERWNAHAEYFGIFSQRQTNDVNGQYFSPGLHYLISPDCEIGTRVGWGLNDDAAAFFSNVGLGIRF
jgi:hypothetical protein